MVLFGLLFGLKVGAFLDGINLLSALFIMHRALVDRRLPLADPILILIVIYGMHSNIVIVFSGVWDQWHIFQPWRVAINYLGVRIAVENMHRKGWEWDHLLSAVNIAIYVHALIIIVTFLIPEWRLAINSLTGFVEKSYLRSPGLTHSYGVTSLIMGFPFLSSPFIKNRLIQGWLVACGQACCFFSLFLTARIGLYILPFILFMVGIRYGVTGRLRLRQFLYVAAPILVTGLLIQAHTAGWFKSEDSSQSENGILNSISVFINENLTNSLEIYFTAQDGEASVQSTETIGKFVFHNNGFMEGLFGTGLYGRGDPGTYLPTDISYAHFFSMAGILGLSLLFLIYLIPILGRLWKIHTDAFWITSVFTMIILVGNYKEATFLTRNIFSLWVIMIWCLEISGENKAKKNDLSDQIPVDRTHKLSLEAR